MKITEKMEECINTISRELHSKGYRSDFKIGDFENHDPGKLLKDYVASKNSIEQIRNLLWLHLYADIKKRPDQDRSIISFMLELTPADAFKISNVTIWNAKNEDRSCDLRIGGTKDMPTKKEALVIADAMHHIGKSKNQKLGL